MVEGVFMSVATFQGVVENGQIRLASDVRLPEKCLTYNVALLVALPSPARQRGSGKAIGRRPALSSRIS